MTDNRVPSRRSLLLGDAGATGAAGLAAAGGTGLAGPAGPASPTGKLRPPLRWWRPRPKPAYYAIADRLARAPHHPVLCRLSA